MSLRRRCCRLYMYWCHCRYQRIFGFHYAIYATIRHRCRLLLSPMPGFATDAFRHHDAADITPLSWCRAATPLILILPSFLAIDRHAAATDITPLMSFAAYATAMACLRHWLPTYCRHYAAYWWPQRHDYDYWYAIEVSTYAFDYATLCWPFSSRLIDITGIESTVWWLAAEMRRNVYLPAAAITPHYRRHYAYYYCLFT